MSEVVHDIDRPDVNGVAPKMQAICDQAKTQLAGLVPHLTIRTSDNLGSNVMIAGSFDARETWNNGIFENSRYFRISINPSGNSRYYAEGEKVSVEMFGLGYKIGAKNMRKYTGTPEKCIGKIAEWIAKVSA